MKGLVLTLLLTASLAVPATAEAYPCYKNGKTIRADQCAFINMNEYANYAYFRPVMQTFWVKSTSKGRFHSRWSVYVQAGGPDGGLLVQRRVRLSASRCRNTFTIFDHRKDQWSSAC